MSSYRTSNNEDALAGDFSKEWKQAADSEFKSLMDNQTWDLVELASGRRLIGSKWVFKVKHGCEGLMELQHCLRMLRVKMGLEEINPQPPDELSGSVKGSN